MDLLVKKVTTVPKDGNVLDVAGELLAPVKQACKSSADSTKAVFYYASMDLKKRSGAVRIRALVLMDCLIHRSKQFRELVCADVKQIARCMGLLPSYQGTSSKAANSDRYVAPVTSYAAELESKGKELIEVWDHLYGDRYPQLRAIARYFRETLRLDMPNIMENARLHAERADRSKQHAQNLLLLTKDKILAHEWRDRTNEWDTSLSRLGECFAILFPRIGDSIEDFALPAAQSDETEGVEWEDEAGESGGEEEDGEGAQSGSSYSASGGAPYTLTIKLSTTARELETADNSVLVQTIRELARFLARSAVPRLLHYKEVFAGCATLYGAQIAELSGVEGPVVASAASGTSCGAVGGTGGAGAEASVLGKRASTSGSDAADSRGATDEPAPSMSPAMARLVESKQEVDSRLSEVLALLHKIRVMLTGKVRELLKDEVI